MEPDIEMLQALHGDAFVLHCRRGDDKGIVVVDGGPEQNSRRIVERLDELGTIDLIVLTHYDDDHIGGILAYIKKHKDDKPFPVKEMWINCAYEIPVHISSNVSFGQAKRLADELMEINQSLVNEGYPIVKWQEPITSDKGKVTFPFGDFTILSPTPDIKQMNDENYHEDIVKANIGRKFAVQKVALNTSLNKLVLNKKEPPKKTKPGVINWSSIAFVVECDSFKALMLGDSYPCTILESLKGWNVSKSNPLKLDYVKVSHHGSRFNISNDLLDMIECDTFLISTNGGKGVSCHPDRETIANILCHTNRTQKQTIRLYFNYPLKQIVARGYQFLKNGEQEKYNFEVYDNVQQIEK